MDQMAKAIKRAVSVHLRGCTAQSIIDRGVCERHIVEVTLDGGAVVIFKIHLTYGDITGFDSPNPTM